MSQIQEITDGDNIIRKKIKVFIINNFLLGANSTKLNDYDSFMGKGIIDSTGVLELVSFIEETFKIKVEDEELIPDNLDSVDKLIGYIKRKIKS